MDHANSKPIQTQENSNSVSLEKKNAPLLRFAARSKNGTFTYVGDGKKFEKDVISSQHGIAMEYNRDGSLFAIVETEEILIYDTQTNKVVSKIARPKVTAISFSPLSTYMLTFEKSVTTGENGQRSPNVFLWEISTGKIVLEFVCKVFAQENWPFLKWTDDEKYCAKMESNEIHIWEKANLKPFKTLRVENVSTFVLSPGTEKYKIGTFSPEKKSQPASVKVFNLTTLEEIIHKNFFNAEEAEMRWNSLSTHLLVLSRTDEDKTGKSYYGHSNVHFLSASGTENKSYQLGLKKEGPVHDIAWDPTGKNFLVVYGHFPANITVFDLKCNPVIDLASDSRNHAKYSPSGRLICVGGFGSLPGSIDFWDQKKLKVIGSCVASSSSFYDWSRDSRYLLTAILFPKLKVDNSFRVWSYDGTSVFSEGFQELYEVKWLPEPVSHFPERPPSPRLYQANSKPAADPNPSSGTSKPSSAGPGKYIPPHLRGKQQQSAAISSENPFGSTGSSVAKNILKQETHGPIRHKKETQSAAPEPSYPIGYIPEKKKKKKKKKATTEKEEETQEGANQVEEVKPQTENTTVAPTSSGKTEAEKRVKAIGKKLKQIQELKKKETAGQILNQAEIEKLNSETKLLLELETLNKK